MHPVAITACTLVNGLGAGRAATFEALRDRRSGLTHCEFEDVVLDTWIGRVAALESRPLPAALAAYECRNNRLALWSLQQDDFEAAAAGARQRYGPARIGVFAGTSTSGILQTELAYRRRDPATGALPADFNYAKTHNSYSLADFVRTYLRLQGPATAVSSACSSSAKVFGNASRMLALGVIDAAVVCGVDSLCLTTLYGFNALGLVSREPCRPYDRDRAGISIGEGGGFALLERPVAAPSAAIHLTGVGESSDAHHMSSPHPEGLGARLAMQAALEAAGLRPEDIDYINAHGTATKANDASEDRAITDVFGDTVPCSSTKGYTGHLLGAAGITEAIVSMLAMEHGLLPGSLHTRHVDPALKCGYLIDNRLTSATRVLSNSFGFGGSNCSLIFECTA